MVRSRTDVSHNRVDTIERRVKDRVEELQHITMMVFEDTMANGFQSTHIEYHQPDANHQGLESAQRRVQIQVRIQNPIKDPQI